MQPLNDVFERAADWLEDHEWTQHGYGLVEPDRLWEPGDPGSPFCACALGAIATANRFRRNDTGFVDAAATLAEHLQGTSLPDDPDVPLDDTERYEAALSVIERWNDAPERKKRHVVAVLRHLANERT